MGNVCLKKFERPMILLDEDTGFRTSAERFQTQRTRPTEDIQDTLTFEKSFDVIEKDNFGTIGNGSRRVSRIGLQCSPTKSTRDNSHERLKFLQNRM